MLISEEEEPDAGLLGTGLADTSLNADVAHGVKSEPRSHDKASAHREYREALLVSRTCSPAAAVVMAGVLSATRGWHSWTP